MQENGELDRKIWARLQGGGNAWNKVSGVMYDRKIPMSLKSQVYRTMVRPAMLYSAETWPVREIQVK